MSSIIFAIFLLALSHTKSAEGIQLKEDFQQLTAEPTIRRSKISSDDPVDLYIYKGISPTVLHLWRSVTVVVNFTSGVDPDFHLRHSSNQSELIEAIRQGVGWFELPWTSARLSPFVDNFVALNTRMGYAVSVRISLVDVRLALLCIGGILVFFNAGRLARNAAFFYSTGVGFMLLGSLLVLILLLSRMIPRRSFGLSMLIGGWSFASYLLYWIASNIGEICLQHYRLLAGYVVTVALVSFGLLYRLGPPTSRSLNLAQWGLQLVGLGMIYWGCQIPEVSAALILLSLAVYNLPQRHIRRFFKRIRWRYFPPPRRLLTEEEYQLQGAVETQKALAELRQFCLSPKCSPWKTVSRLRSPDRFANFVEGKSHLTDAEVLNFDSTEWFGRNGSDPNDVDIDDDNEFLTDDDSSDDQIVLTTPVATGRLQITKTPRSSSSLHRFVR